MTALLQTSPAFASAMASGADWREIGRKILESLESIRTENDGMSIGFVYATAALAPDMGSLLALLKHVTRINQWYGSVGQGICGGGQSRFEGPAAVAMIGRMPEGSFHGYVLSEDDGAATPKAMQDWMAAGHMPVATLTHGILCAQAAQRLRHWRERDGYYAVGGFAAAGAGGLHICDGAIVKAGDVLSGVALDAGVAVMTATSFGCMNAGVPGRITQCSGNVIEKIDDMEASAFLHGAIDQLRIEDIDVGDVAATHARRGHVHAAFPIAGADGGQFLVRNITAVNDQGGSLTVAHHFERGDAIQFVYRDRTTATKDLTQVLTRLYGRAADTVGAANLKPKAILYFGCGARMPEDVGHDEAALIANVFSGVPMAGFYTAAEICNGHVYGYTGVIVLLL